MGKIFTWKEVESKEIPDSKDFTLLQEALIKKLRGSRAISGAQICGSIARGDSNIRSDVDVVVVYRTGWEKQAISLFHDLSVQANQLHIPLELIVVDDESANTPDHTFTPSFLEHLQMTSDIPGCVIKQSPHSIIVSSGDDLLDDARMYVRQKVRKFRKAIASFPVLTIEEKMHLFQKVLEFPIYAARKLLRAYGYEFPSGDGKEQIRILSKNSIFSTHAYEALAFVNLIDTSYTFELERQLEELNEDSYNLMLEDIENAVPLSQYFADDCLSLIRDKLSCS